MPTGCLLRTGRTQWVSRFLPARGPCSTHLAVAVGPMKLMSTVAPVETRVRHIEETLPDIGSLDVTTGNQGEGATEFVYLTRPAH